MLSVPPSLLQTTTTPSQCSTTSTLFPRSSWSEFRSSTSVLLLLRPPTPPQLQALPRASNCPAAELRSPHWAKRAWSPWSLMSSGRRRTSPHTSADTSCRGRTRVMQDIWPSQPSIGAQTLGTLRRTAASSGGGLVYEGVKVGEGSLMWKCHHFFSIWKKRGTWLNGWGSCWGLKRKTLWGAWGCCTHQFAATGDPKTPHLQNPKILRWMLWKMPPLPLLPPLFPPPPLPPSSLTSPTTSAKRAHPRTAASCTRSASPSTSSAGVTTSSLRPCTTLASVKATAPEFSTTATTPPTTPSSRRS